MDRKGFAPIIVLLVVAGVLAIGGIYVFLRRSDTRPPLVTSVSTSSVATSGTSSIQSVASSSGITSNPTLLFYKQFKDPYPTSSPEWIFWVANPGYITINGLGLWSVPDDPSKVQLRFGLTTHYADCLPLHFRRIIDERGTWVLPDANSSIACAGKDVVFSVPATENNFLFEAGDFTGPRFGDVGFNPERGDSVNHVFFFVNILPDGSFDLQNSTGTQS